MPDAFTLNGRRCDATIIITILAAATPAADVTATPPVAAGQMSTWDTPPDESKPEKPHDKSPNGRRG